MQSCGITPEYTYLLNTCRLGDRAFHVHVSSHKLVITELWVDGDLQQRSVTIDERFSESSEWTHNLGVCAFNGKIFVMLHDSSGGRKAVCALVDPREGGGRRIRSPIRMQKLEMRGYRLSVPNWRFLVQYDDRRILMTTHQEAAMYSLEVDAGAATCVIKKYSERIPDGMQFSTGLLAIPGNRVLAVGGTILDSNSDHRRTVTTMTPKEDSIEFRLKKNIQHAEKRCQTPLLLLYGRFALGFGGWKGKYLHDMFVYDTQTETISTVRRGSSWHNGDSLSFLFIHEEVLYIIGGYKARSCYRINIDVLFESVRDPAISAALQAARASGAPICDPDGREFAIPIGGAAAPAAGGAGAPPVAPAAPAAPVAPAVPPARAAPVDLGAPGIAATLAAPAASAVPAPGMPLLPLEQVRSMIAAKEKEVEELRRRVAEASKAHPDAVLDEPRFFPGAMVPDVPYRNSRIPEGAFWISCRPVPVSRGPDGQADLRYHRNEARVAACLKATMVHSQSLPSSSHFRRAYQKHYASLQNTNATFRVFSSTPEEVALQTALAHSALAGERGILAPGLATDLRRLRAHTLSPQLKLRDNQDLCWWKTENASDPDAALLHRMCPPVASPLLHLFDSIDPLALERGMFAAQGLIPDIRANRLLAKLATKSAAGGLGIREAAKALRRLDSLIFPEEGADAGSAGSAEGAKDAGDAEDTREEPLTDYLGFGGIPSSPGDHWPDASLFAVAPPCPAYLEREEEASEETDEETEEEKSDSSDHLTKEPTEGARARMSHPPPVLAFLEDEDDAEAGTGGKDDKGHDDDADDGDEPSEETAESGSELDAEADPGAGKAEDGPHQAEVESGDEYDSEEYTYDYEEYDEETDEEELSESDH